MNATPALQVRDLRVRRGARETLHIDALDVAQGETLALLGPNGAGKTTLLLAAAFLLDPSAGEVRLFGQTAAEAGRVTLRRQTATVFQDASLLDMSVRQNVETALALRGVGRAERRERADRWLQHLGVRHLADARPHTLSGGEAQRVSLARACAVEPSVLFLDEPFSGLDPAARAQLLGDLHTLLADEGVTAILATHDLSEAELLADRALVLMDGVPAQLGPTDEVLRHPTSLPVAEFLGFSALPLALVRAVHGIEQAGAWALVPPQGAALADAGDGATLTGTVLAVQGGVGRARVIVDVGAQLAVDVPASEVRRRALAHGVAVSVRIDPRRIAWL